MKKILLGIDYGTGGCKVTAIDEEGGFVGEASTEFPTYHEHSGWSEQEPSDWWKALCESLAKLRAKGVDLARVAALALDGSTHNAVLLARDSVSSDSPNSLNPLNSLNSLKPLNPSALLLPVRRTIMWTDQRATAECEFLRSERRADGRVWADYLFERCYQMPAPTWTLPQLMWLKRHEPQTLAKTEHVLFVKDYVRYLLTGHVATDYIEAEGTLMFDMAASVWLDDLVELAGLKPGVMPAIIKPTDVVGGVSAAAAAATGLPEGARVVCGTSDSAVEDYGAGAVESGDLIIKLATAGNVNSMTDSARPHPKTLTYSHVVPGMWYSVSATNAAALCQRWWRDNFYAGEDASANVWATINAEAEGSPVGAGGVMFHPYLQGERCPYWDADLRASFTGVSISSTRGDFARALMEGVAYSLRDCYRTLEEMRLPVKRIFLIGGGAKSRLWSEIVANVFNCTVMVPSPADASFGSCLLAGTGIGLFADAKAAVAKCLKIDREVKSDPAAAAEYARLFERYRRIHDALSPIYSETRA